MVVSAVGDEFDAALHESFSQGLGIVGDTLGVVAERLGASFGQGDGLGCHDVGERATEDHRAATIDVGGILLGRQHHATTWAAQGLVGRRRHHLSVGDRVLVTGEYLAGHQAGEVSHVDHEDGSDLVGDLAHLREVHPARVGGVPGDDDEGPELACQLGDLVVIEQTGLRVRSVGALVEHLARDVRTETVGEVAAGVQAHADGALVVEAVAQGVPVGLGEVVDGARSELLEGWGLDVMGEDRPVGSEVGVNTGVRLHVGMLSAEEGAGVLGSNRLNGVDVLAAGVEAVTGGTLGVLVGEPGTHGRKDGQGCVVLGSDELEGMTLVGQFGSGGLRNPGLNLCDRVEHGAVSRGQLLGDVAGCGIDGTGLTHGWLLS